MTSGPGPAPAAPLGEVIISVDAMGGDRERVLAAGMDDYVSKPVNPDTLNTVVNRWLGAESAAQAVQA